MADQSFEVYEFKYSAKKLLVRYAIRLCIGILGIACLILYSRSISTPLRYEVLAHLISVVSVFGFMSSAYPFWRLVLHRRIFLKLDSTGLLYIEVSVLRGMIPLWGKIHVPWSSIESVCLDKGMFGSEKIKLTLKEMERGRNITQSIKVIFSECDAGYIVQVIKRGCAAFAKVDT